MWRLKRYLVLWIFLLTAAWSCNKLDDSERGFYVRGTFDGWRLSCQVLIGSDGEVYELNAPTEILEELHIGDEYCVFGTTVGFSSCMVGTPINVDLIVPMSISTLCY